MSTILLLLIGFAFLAGLAAAYTRIRRIVRIQRTPTSPINALPYEGDVEVTGSASLPVTKSPITRTDCAYWQVEVKARRSTGRSSSWYTIFKKSSDEIFQVQDGTGFVSVLPAGADVLLNDDFQKTSGFLTSLDAETLQAVRGLGVETEGLWGMKKTLKVTEKVISNGDVVYVLGQVDSGGGMKIIKSFDKSPLILSDRSEKKLLLGLYTEAAALVLGLPALVGLVVVLSLG